MAHIDPYLMQSLEALEEEAQESGLEATGDGYVRHPMLIRVSDPGWEGRNIPEFSITGRLGDIVSCSGSRRAIHALQDDPSVVAIEASRFGATLDCVRSLPFVHVDKVHAGPPKEEGDKALVAIIDGGIDVLHDAFQDGKGKTRILAIWDQTDSTGPPPAGRTIGTLHTEADINGYLAAGAVPAGLGRDSVGHGTHVASIAAGSPGNKFVGGVARAARLLVVIPKLDVKNPNDPRSLGYSNSHVDALDFIKKFARQKKMPVVVNVSLGKNAGAHDGTSLLEAAFDNFSGGGREGGYVIVKSAGNEGARDGHATVTLAAGAQALLTWQSKSAPRRTDAIELWFRGCDEMRFRLQNPSKKWSSQATWANPSVASVFPKGNKYLLTYTRYHHDNGDSRLLVVIERGSRPEIEKGTWTLEIENASTALKAVIEAWIERDDRRPVSFTSYQSNEMTLSIPATARSVVAVASVEAKKPYRTGKHSSWGPTRDGRPKPDLSAPGVDIEAAKAGTADDLEPMSGTSMAAPHVTGAIALLFSAWEKKRAAVPNWQRLNAAQVRAALGQMSLNFTPAWDREMGFGILDALKLCTCF